MARTKVLPDLSKTEPGKATPEQWIERLTILLKTIDAMDSDERCASLRYVKSKFAREWPGDEY